MKVHILIAGWDKDRSVFGCARLGADKIYIITPKKHGRKDVEEWVSEKSRKCAEIIKEKYSKLFSVKLVPVSYGDYADCFKAFMKIIKSEQAEGNEVFVNISSGSHVAAAAGIFAASLTKCRAYYVIMKRYDEIFKKEDRFISYGGKSIVEIPLLPISFLSSTEIGLLKIISKHNSIAEPDLAKTAEAQKLFFKASRSKINYYLKKFEENGFVENKIKGGKMLTKITGSGKMIVEAFG